MYDNSNLEVRCRALWADVLCAVESRVSSLNEYARNARTQLDCQMLTSDSLKIDYPAVHRSVVATLDLQEHAIQIHEFEGEEVSFDSKLPFAMLADGNVYVTDGLSLLGDSMAVARQMITALLTNPNSRKSAADLDPYRSWASALITVRAPRTQIRLPIEIQTENALHPASTLDMSVVGVKVQSTAELDRGNYVTIFRGTLGSFFRVVWSEKTREGTRAGLICLNPPLEWAENMV